MLRSGKGLQHQQANADHGPAQGGGKQERRYGQRGEPTDVQAQRHHTLTDHPAGSGAGQVLPGRYRLDMTRTRGRPLVSSTMK